MKTITKLDDSSAFSGVHKKNNEMYLRPISEVDENGNKRELKDRCYVFRLLGFSDDNGLRTYPFMFAMNTSISSMMITESVLV